MLNKHFILISVWVVYLFVEVRQLESKRDFIEHPVEASLKENIESVSCFA